MRIYDLKLILVFELLAGFSFLCKCSQSLSDFKIYEQNFYNLVLKNLVLPIAAIFLP